VGLPRRNIVRLGMQIVSAYALFPLVVGRARGADTCTDAASEGLRSSLHYTAAAPDPKQACSGCGFYSQGEAQPVCGNCMIMGGPVNPKGHCDSWSSKS
jgi:hypothetical protein